MRKSTLYRETEFARRIEVTISNHRVSLVSAEDLLLSKLVWAKDSQSAVMKDTPDHIEDLMRTMMMKRTGEDRMIMGCSMFDAAKTMARASLSHLPEQELRIRLFKRFYGAEFDMKTQELIIARIIHDCP